ncbi:MAG: HNH endonuclease [Alphaproteobacteria bacterium]|nr:MAG: HNH endonuclease [Alphaproteobacteria bacterium]
MRRSMSRTRRLRIFEAASGICHICGQRIDGTREPWEVEHIVPIQLGGEDEDANCAPAHVACHRAKTREDVARIAKAKRVRAKHLGAHRPRATLPGSRASRWKRKISGEVVRRNEE